MIKKLLSGLVNMGFAPAAPDHKIPEPVSQLPEPVTTTPMPEVAYKRVRLTYVAMASGFLVVTDIDGVCKYTTHKDIRHGTPFLSRKDADKHGGRAAPMLHGFAQSYYALVQPA